jgi:hypothetical protein
MLHLYRRQAEQIFVLFMMNCAAGLIDQWALPLTAAMVLQANLASWFPAPANLLVSYRT